MHVRRTLPARERSLIGAWCFVDHYGPHQVGSGPGMDVPPHPHTGLQTVSWLFRGEIEHRDSAGVHALVRPGELNLMTAGAGICHSEVSTPATTVLHGVQLWVALPDADRDTARDFVHYVPSVHARDGARVRVFLGELAGARSPAPTFTPLLGAQVDLGPGATVAFDVDPGFEHGVLVDTGVVDIADSAEGAATETKPGELAYVAPGRHVLRLTAYDEARVMLLGGEPLGESIVMWWNFVGRTHEEIVAFREEWQAQIAEASDGQDVRPGRFGIVTGEHLPPIPAPALPNARLKERR